MKRILGAVWFLAVAAALSAQAPGGDVEVLQLRPNFYMIAGAGANVVIQVGDDGAVVVDTGTAATASRILAAIQKVTDAPIRYIINTSADPDHVGGNEIISKAGQTLFGTRSTGLPDSFRGNTAASILAAEKVLTRMSAPTGQTSPFPFASWPTETFDYDRRYMYLNGEGIEVFHRPSAHTDGNSIVFFRRSDVVVAGDIFETERFPVIDVARGGSVQGELDALNHLVSIAIPSVPIVSREAGTLVVPGHGHVGDQFDVVHYRDMITIIRDHVADLIKSGRTLDQIKAAAPAKGYSGRYGTDSAWTTDKFIEAVYQSLNRK